MERQDQKKKDWKWIRGEFEKEFNVYATNRIVGMQLLTSDVMEMLIDFKKKANIRYDIVIDNETIYLRFHCGSLFEPRLLKKKVLDEKSLKSYYNILNFTYELTNKIIKVINDVEI